MHADLEVIAAHEAGHAVMRWLVGLPCTELTAGPNGGFCAGSGRSITARDALYVTLAGIAVETVYGLAKLDLENSYGDDLDRARWLLADAQYLLAVVVNDVPRIATVDEALIYHLDKAGEWLFPYAELIDRIADELIGNQRLSARSVAALCRKFKRSVRNA